MQDEVRAETGDRDAEHDGEEVFVHDDSPFAPLYVRSIPENVSGVTQFAERLR
jgi:hypothetical protein